MQRDKRRKNYWEPVFDPNDKEDFPEANWDSTTTRHVTLSANKLDADEKHVFDRKIFEECDFIGDFTQVTPSFKSCEFKKCDFGLSKWKRARFKRCVFNRTSFTLATFESCEFRDCSFAEIGISGNETILPGTIITNVDKFLAAAYTASNPKETDSEKIDLNKQYQEMRLEETRSTVARALLNNLEKDGSEDNYYQAVRVHQIKYAKSKILRKNYEIRRLKEKEKRIFIRLKRAFCLRWQLVIYESEKFIVGSAGLINGWGNSIARSAAFGLGIGLVFSVIYYLSGIRDSVWSAVITSADISLLVGYTKHAVVGEDLITQSVYLLNMGLGIVWYSIFIATIINKVSRVR